MSEQRTCWCGAVIGPKEMQCECCRADPPCQHRRQQQRVGRSLVGTSAPDEAHVSEAERQEEIRRALIAAGFSVYRIGQRDARGTQDPGIPDLYALHREHGVIWIECKRPHGGVLSRAQLEFREACARAGQTYVVASQVGDLTKWLDVTTNNPKGLAL